MPDQLKCPQLPDKKVVRFLRWYTNERLRDLAPLDGELLKGKLQAYQELDEVLRMLNVPDEEAQPQLFTTADNMVKGGTTMNHTPTPWTYKRSCLPNGIEQSWDCAIIDSEKCIVAETFGIVDGYQDRPSIANAEFIVRACNSHEAMKEALQGIVAYLSVQRTLDPTKRGPLDEQSLLAAQHALTVAEGKETKQ